MAEKCQLGNTIEAFKRHLTNSSMPWLLILDNADDPSLEIAQYFPTGNRGTIIVTSRNVQCRMHATTGSKELREMDPDEAVDLFLRSADLDSDDEQLQNSALPIVQTLVFLPLAIAQAGASILQGICTVEDYLEIYEGSRAELLSERPLQSIAGYEYTVYTTWEISVRSIRNKSENEQTNTASDALELLNLFGFFHFDNITEETIKFAWENKVKLEHYPWWKSNMIRLLQGGLHTSWDPLEYRQAIGLLSRYSLIQFGQSNRQISIHPLVHSWIRDSLSEEAQRKWWSATISTIALAPERNPYPFQSQLVLHAIHCMTASDPELLLLKGDFANEKITISINLIDLYIETSRLKHILVFAEMVVVYSKNFLGDCALTCAIAVRLAKIYLYMENYQKCSDLLEDWLSVSARVVGATDDITTSMMYMLAKVYKNTDRIPDALQLARRSVSILEESPDVNSLQHHDALANLASIHCKMGQHESALKFLEKASNLREYPELKGFRILEDRIAHEYDHLGRYQDARKSYEIVLKYCLEAYGEENDITVDTVFELGRVFGCIGQAERGIPLVGKAIDIATKTSVIDDSMLQHWKETLEDLRAQLQDNSGHESHEQSSLQWTEHRSKRRRQVEESSS